jgi:hypothetical protein
VYERYDFADGAELLWLFNFWDEQRQEPCEVQTLSDGKLHCAPRGEPLPYGPDEFFADATCTTSPVIGTRTDVRTPYCSIIYPQGAHRYFQLPSNRSCEPVRLIDFPTTAPLAVSTIYRKSGSTCSAFSVAPGADYIDEIYASPPLPLVEVAPSSFATVTRTETIPVTSSRIRGAMYASSGDDGSKWTSLGGFVDSARNEYCYPTDATDGTSRCMPRGGEVESWGFSDPGCTKPVSEVVENGGCLLDSLDTWGSYMTKAAPATACGNGGTILYPRFTGQTLSTIYQGTPSSCSVTSVGPSWGISFYSQTTLPAPLPPSTFSEISEGWADTPNYRYVRNGSRITFKSFDDKTPDGFHQTSDYASPSDTKWGDCYPMTLADGNLYCVPSTAPYFAFDSSRPALFADAACSVPVLGVDAPSTGCGGALASVYVEQPAAVGSCMALRFYRVPKTPIASPKLYAFDTNAKCAPSTENTSQYAFFRRSDCEEISPTEFVAVTPSLQK